MNEADSSSSKFFRSEGINDSERYLSKLARRSFLSLWSYSGIYRDQGKKTQTSDGKEVCDLLVVFGNHLIIFSDKDCEFPNTGDLDLDWSRWYRKAIEKSAKQIWGAERWLLNHPDKIYLDRACTIPFPIDLPNGGVANIHRIVVAHGSAERCKKELGGIGSLMIDTDLNGNDHYIKSADGGTPFAVGQVDLSKGFVHVLDDATLDILLNNLDTISDFIAYLEKKELFLNNGNNILAAGEEDLVAFYLGNLNKQGEHDFILPKKYDVIFLEEGYWEEFANSEQRKEQLEADEVSYFWDFLIEKFNTHLLDGTQYSSSHTKISDTELAHRFLARETRFRRRVLSKTFLDLLSLTPPSIKGVRIIKPVKEDEPYYIFLVLPIPSFIGYKDYRLARGNLLEIYCRIIKLRFADAQDIIGIATETEAGQETRSEDLLYFDARNWSEEERDEAQKLQDDLGLLNDVTLFRSREYEYPSKENNNYGKRSFNKIGRNEKCPCGSGKKYKHCCMRKTRQSM